VSVLHYLHQCRTVLIVNGNSESDTRLTHKIKEAGNLMDIQLLDYLILTMDDRYYSFADNGLL